MAVQISGNDITVPRAGSFTRNVTIGGTLTYEDVTNIDSVGLVTARNGIEIGARPGVAASISVDGNMIVSGITTFGGDVQVSDKIIHAGDTDTAIRFPATNYVTIESSGVEKVEFRPSEVTFNDTGIDCDFRIEGDSNANLFKVDAGNDRVGVGLAAPQQVFHVYHASDNGLALFESGDANCRIDLKDNSGQASVEAIGDALRFGTSSSNTERLRIDSNGKIGVGGAPSAWQAATTSNVIQLGTACIFNYNNDYFHVGQNFYYDGSNYKYVANDPATRLLQDNGKFTFYQAASGSADANITWTEALSITSAGDVDVEDGDIFFSTSGKGIVLGATSNTDANTLDDYEEGTFAAEIVQGLGSITQTFDNSATYTKIGNLVHVQAVIQFTGVGNGTAVFLKLPFTHVTDTSLGGGVISFTNVAGLDSESTLTLIGVSAQSYCQVKNKSGNPSISGSNTNKAIYYHFTYQAA